MTLEVDLVPFAGTPSRADFDCGNASLNDWLRSHASQHEKSGMSRTTLAVPKKGTLATWHAVGFEDVDDTTILGFFSLSAAQIPLDQLPQGKHPKSVPAIRMGRLAVHRLAQGRGFGELLLMEAIARAAETSAAIGVGGLFVDAKDEKAAAFYAKYGFQPSLDDPLKLWLSLKNLLQYSSG